MNLVASIAFAYYLVIYLYFTANVLIVLTTEKLFRTLSSPRPEKEILDRNLRILIKKINKKHTQSRQLKCLIEYTALYQ